MIIVSRKKLFVLIAACALVSMQSVSAAFATPNDAKSALAAAMSGPVANFGKLTQIDPKAANDAIAALKKITDSYASSTVPAVQAAVKDAVDSMAAWNATLATIPNISAEMAKFTTAQGTLSAAIATVESTLAVNTIATAKKAAADAVAAAAASIKPATDALAAAQGALNTIASDSIFTSGGGKAPAMPWAAGSTTASSATTTTTSTGAPITTTATK